MDLKRQRLMLRGAGLSCGRAGWNSLKEPFYRGLPPKSPASLKFSSGMLTKPLANPGAFSFSAQFTDTFVHTPGWDT